MPPPPPPLPPASLWSSQAYHDNMAGDGLVEYALFLPLKSDLFIFLSLFFVSLLVCFVLFGLVWFSFLFCFLICFLSSVLWCSGMSSLKKFLELHSSCVQPSQFDRAEVSTLVASGTINNIDCMIEVDMLKSLPLLIGSDQPTTYFVHSLDDLKHCKFSMF